MTIKWKNEEDFFAWLKQQPSKVGIPIAARAALRVVPLAALAVPASRDDETSQRVSQLALALFRATALTWCAGTYPIYADELRLAAYSAGDAADDAPAWSTSAAVRATAYSSARAARTVTGARATAADASRAARRAAEAASYVMGSAGDDIWAAVSYDSDLITTIDTMLEQANARLWPNGMPLWAEEHWQKLKSALPSDENWRVWFHWYENRLEGRSSGITQDLAYANIPDELWEQGPLAVNNWIKSELERIARVVGSSPSPEDSTPGPWLSVLSVPIATPLGSRWLERDGQLVIDPKGEQSDASAAQEPTTIQLHAILKLKSADFVTMCTDIDNRVGWSGFGQAINRFNSEISRNIQEIPLHITNVYDAAVVLGSYLELDNALNKNRLWTNMSPLEADVRRAFSDLVRTAAPWVRAFPTARKLDDQAGAFLSRKELFEPSSAVVETAGRQALISDADKDLLVALITATQKNDPLSHKAGVRGVKSTTSLVLKALGIIATFYAGAASNIYSGGSPIVKKIGDVLLERENEVLQLTTDLPADIRLAVQMAIKTLKEVALHSKSPQNNYPGKSPPHPEGKA